MISASSIDFLFLPPLYPPLVVKPPLCLGKSWCHNRDLLRIVRKCYGDVMALDGHEENLDGGKILLVEDDLRLGELQRDYLSQQGFEVTWHRHGRNVDADLDELAPDVIVLDLKLPGLSGLDICRGIRNRYTGKIIFLTSSDDDFDHVAGIELGADDYLVKPVNPRVLLAHIRMLLRRKEHDASVENASDVEVLRHGALEIKEASQQVSLAGDPVKLSNAEFKLLWLLASHPDQVMMRADLFQTMRGIAFDGLDRSVDTKIVALRKKLHDSATAPTRILTIRNKGYLFASDAW